MTSSKTESASLRTRSRWLGVVLGHDTPEASQERIAALRRRMSNVATAQTPESGVPGSSVANNTAVEHPEALQQWHRAMDLSVQATMWSHFRAAAWAVL